MNVLELLILSWAFIGVIVAFTLCDDYEESPMKNYNKYQSAFILFCFGPFIWCIMILLLCVSGFQIAFHGIMNFLGTLDKKDTES